MTVMNYFIIPTDAEINILALSRGLADQFQIVMESIYIPETLPNGRATISVEFDARGDEDIFVSTWIIVNDEGKDCFPDHTASLSVSAKAGNKSFKRSSGK